MSFALAVALVVIVPMASDGLFCRYETPKQAVPFTAGAGGEI
jgi:hypothetical protein